MPRGEDKAIKTLQGGRQHSGIKRDPVDKIVDGKSRVRIVAALELAHVVADAGKSLQPAIAVEKILHLGGRHSLYGHQVQNDAGIDLAGAAFPSEVHRVR